MEKYENISTDISTTESIFMSELIDNSNGLSIMLCEAKTDRKIIVSFPPVYSHRNTNESYRLRTQFDFGNDVPDLLSLVEGSKFLEWFHKESQGIYMDNNLKHFLIFTGEEFIDVISHVEPLVVEKIDLNN